MRKIDLALAIVATAVLSFAAGFYVAADVADSIVRSY